VREISEFERDIRMLEAELRKLERDYNMFFAGRLPKPPWDERKRVELLVRKYDRAPLTSFAERFRFQTLQSRYAAFVDLWDRGLRAKEEGRPGPFLKPARPEKGAGDGAKPADRVVHVATVADPIKESGRSRSFTSASSTPGARRVKRRSRSTGSCSSCGRRC